MLKQMKRAVHFDFHTLPGVDDFGEDFDAARFAQQLQDANVGYINFFARCNIGFSYYPTKVGVPYPNSKGNMLGDVVRECHKRDIGVTGYINAGLHHEYSRIHPEWLQVMNDGRIYVFDAKRGMSFFRTVCYNTGYRDLLLAEVREVLAQGVDGLFLDCMEVRPCHCANCTRDMLARGIDINDEVAVKDFAFEIRKKMCEDIRAIVPEDKRLFFNGVRQSHNKHLATHHEVESLWSYDFFYAHAAYARSMRDTFIYMNGRFQAGWGDFGGYKGKASLENDFYDALVCGAVPMLGDHLHPARIAESDIYKDLGEIYAKLMKYEKWTDGTKMVSEIAIITDNAYLNDIHFGAARLLSELKYTYDILDVDADFSSYKLVLLPDTVRVCGVLKENLKKYLENGGKVISTGLSGLNEDDSAFALPEWDFAYCGKETADTSYFRFKETPAGLADMDYSYYTSGVLLKAKAGDTVLADAMDGYAPNHSYDGRHWYRYVPPKAKNGYSAVTVNASGNVAHVSFALFADFLKHSPKCYREIIRLLIEKFYPNNLIRTKDMPSYSRLSVADGDGYRVLHVKVTYPEIRGKRGIVEEHTEIFGGRTVAVRGEFTKVCRLPDESEVESRVENGYTYITLPAIVGYDAFLLK